MHPPPRSLASPARCLLQRCQSRSPSIPAAFRPERCAAAHSSFCTSTASSAQHVQGTNRSPWANHRDTCTTTAGSTAAASSLGRLSLPRPLRHPQAGWSSSWSLTADLTLGPRKPLASHKRFASTVSAASNPS
ncbi:hypothetical protein ACCO45_008683 [Purpureocillium lilacinum]|uniref:Uncharacterized protein n=1 Tax=Purpureocillium lilacinum TaxID=33203 RepID=A0ACC4DP13_PURLI